MSIHNVYPALDETMVNRTDQSAFLATLYDAVDGARRDKRVLGLIVLQLDNMNRINTSLGYGAGESLLTKTAKRLTENIQPHDQAVRIGTRKFAILLTSLMNEGHALLAANKITRAAREPVELNGSRTSVDFSMGISVFPDHADDAEGLLQRAELALAKAEQSRTPYHMYSPGKTREVAALWGLEHELDAALEMADFYVHYQPKLRLRDMKPVGAEALIRWKSQMRGEVPPAVFIPVADETGRIRPLTQLVLSHALRNASDWPLDYGPLSVAINATPNVLQDTDLVNVIEDAVAIWGTDAGKLVIEVTEGAVMTDPKTSFEVLQRLRDLGIQISIDDFGTGYSSLAYFKNIPADELKIDRSFVASMLEDEADQRIVQSVIDLAHNFELGVVAEGVETLEQLELLLSMGCDSAQGFLFSRPLPHADFSRWIDKYRPGDFG